MTGAGHTSYLRASAMATYSQGEWYVEDGITSTAYDGGTIAVPDVKLKKLATDSITIRPIVTFAQGFIPTALYTVRTSGADNLEYYPEIYAFKTLLGFSAPYSFEAVRLDESQVPASAQVAADPAYLQLPDEITQRTRDLAEQIVTGLSNPLEKARAIERYLKSTCTYDYEYQRAPADEESVDWFLFTEKKGVCVNFNTAFVVLARSLGIPARLVTGYGIAPQDEEQTVTGKQAHAWAEVPFTGYGWITFDATPGNGIPGGAGENNTASDEIRNSGLPPVIEITGVTTPRDEGAQKGRTFTAVGTVLISTTGKPAQGISVEVYVDTVKGKGGILVGNGRVPDDSADGEFAVECEITNEFNVGTYQLIAHAVGDQTYAESWSDPELKILSGTILTLDVPVEGKADEPAIISGILTEELGNPIAGMPVLIDYSDGTPVKTVLTGADGYFTANHVFTRSGDFTVRATFEDSEYYFGTQQEKSIRIMMPTILTLDVPGEALPQDPVQIQGTLTPVTGAPLAGKTVSLSIDGTPVSDVTTGNDGGFDYSYTFTESGKHTIEARFAGEGLFLESNASTSINIIDVVIDILTPEVMIRNTDSFISGKVFTKNGPVSGEPLHILLDGDPLTEQITGTDGGFSYTMRTGNEIELGKHTLTYSLPAWDRTRTQTVYVKSRTFLFATGPENINPGETVTAVARLLDRNENPIRGENIKTGDQVLHGPTDENGELSISEDIARDTKETEVTFSFTFEETDDYLSSHAELTVPILRQKTVPVWIFLVIAGVLVLGAAGFFGYRYFRNRGRAEIPEESISPAGIGPIVAVERDPKQTMLTIDFPRIERPLPDVWGVQDKLEVRITLKDGKQDGLAGRNVSIQIEPGESKQIETDGQGSLLLKPVFESKGTFTIRADFPGDEDYKSSRAVRSVKIVDYREEIVSLYAELKEWAKSFSIRLPVDITPRLLEGKLVRELAGIDEKALDGFLWYFEEADYSTHIIGRKEYEQAYLALIRVREYNGGTNEQDS